MHATIWSQEVILISYTSALSKQKQVEILESTDLTAETILLISVTRVIVRRDSCRIEDRFSSLFEFWFVSCSIFVMAKLPFCFGCFCICRLLHFTILPRDILLVIVPVFVFQKHNLFFILLYEYELYIEMVGIVWLILY